MTKNEHSIDRIIRVIIGIVALGAAYLYVASIGTVWAVIISVFGVIMLVTAAIGWCPIYAALGLSSRKN